MVRRQSDQILAHIRFLADGSYKVYRPDRNWSVLLVNRDETYAPAVHVQFEDAANKRNATFFEAVTWVSLEANNMFGSATVQTAMRTQITHRSQRP